MRRGLDFLRGGFACPKRVVTRFIDHMGDHMAAEGAPRIAGRLFGLMILEPDPVSFGDLAQRLGVSRGSISTNARLLESQGLIERVQIPGERQDFFRLADQPYANLIRGIALQMEETLAVIAETRHDLPAEALRERRRLEEAQRFFTSAVGSLNDLTSKLAAAEFAESPS